MGLSFHRFEIFLNHGDERFALVSGSDVSRIAGIAENVIALLAEPTRTSTLPILHNLRLTVAARVNRFLEDPATRSDRQPLRDHDLVGHAWVYPVVDQQIALEACE